jgi:hypothetical protein
MLKRSRPAVMSRVRDTLHASRETRGVVSAVQNKPNSLRFWAGNEGRRKNKANLAGPGRKICHPSNHRSPMRMV